MRATRWRRIVTETGKVPLQLVMMGCLDEVALALEEGNKKPGRGPFNWQYQAVQEADMISGALRHIKKHSTGEIYDDPQCRRRHLAHAVARLLIAMDAADHGNLVPMRRKK